MTWKKYRHRVTVDVCDISSEVSRPSTHQSFPERVFLGVYGDLVMESNLHPISIVNKKLELGVIYDKAQHMRQHTSDASYTAASRCELYTRCEEASGSERWWGEHCYDTCSHFDASTDY